MTPLAQQTMTTVTTVKIKLWFKQYQCYNYAQIRASWMPGSYNVSTNIWHNNSNSKFVVLYYKVRQKSSP